MTPTRPRPRSRRTASAACSRGRSGEASSRSRRPTDAKHRDLIRDQPRGARRVGRVDAEEVQKLLAYTSSIGGRIAATELFNEPNLPAWGARPRATTPPATAATSACSCAFIRKAAPGLRCSAPGRSAKGTAGELPRHQERGDADGAAAPRSMSSRITSYNGVSQRCAGLASGGSTLGQTTPEAAFSADWLTRTERDARFYAGTARSLRARHAAVAERDGRDRLRRESLGLDVHRHVPLCRAARTARKARRGCRDAQHPCRERLRAHR